MGAFKYIKANFEKSYKTRSEDYRKRLQEGFLAEAARAGDRIHVIDAARPIDVVHADIWRIAEQLLGSPGLERKNR